MVNLTIEDKREEFIMLSLLKKEGINLKTYEILFSHKLEIEKQAVISAMLKENIIKLENEHLSLTNKGFHILNLVIEKLI